MHSHAALGPCGSQWISSPSRPRHPPQHPVTSGRGLIPVPGTPGPLTGILCVARPTSALRQLVLSGPRMSPGDGPWLAGTPSDAEETLEIGMCPVGVRGHPLHLVGPSLELEHAECESHSVLRDGRLAEGHRPGPGSDPAWGSFPPGM